MKHTVLTLLKLFGWFLLYNVVANALGGINLDLGQLYVELPLVLFSGYWFYRAIKPTLPLPSLLALMPILAYYSFMDYYYAKLGRIFKWVEVTDLPLLLDVMPLIGQMVFLGTLCLAALLILYTWNTKKLASLMLAITPIAFMALFATVSPTQYVQQYEKIARKIYIDERSTTGQNGRIVTPLYFEAKRQVALQQLIKDNDWAEADATQHAELLTKASARNLHIIVMESWLDPTLFSAYPELKDIQPRFFSNLNGARNISIAPVFGGQTPQAEFEILCGTPALQKVGEIEFNFFGGSKTSCLPNWMAQAGWDTFASHAYKPTFFNRSNAYRSLGFQRLYFPADYTNQQDTYLTKGLVGDEPYMLDGAFLNANLTLVESQLKTGKPFLNYALGVYGHWPNQLTPGTVDAEITIGNSNDYEQVNRVINQYIYRTEALSDYLTKLQRLDPNGLILVASDHLPPITGLTNWQQQLGYFPGTAGNEYLNVFYLFDAGRAIVVEDPIHHYELVTLLLSRLQSNECTLPICQLSPNERAMRYEKVISSAIFEY